MAYPLDFMSPKLPGLGDVDWGKYVSALTDIGYDGYTCIEVEDRAFEGSREKVLDSLRLSKRYMEDEIASLLGETTAETKIALTNLKESLKDE